MLFNEIASKCLRCPAARVNLIEDASKFNPAKVWNGVVIFFAVWSAPAHVALKSYTERIAHLKQNIPVWILNIDTLTEEVDQKFPGPKHGYGETYFFRAGVQAHQLFSLEGNYADRFQAKWEEFFGKE